MFPPSFLKVCGWIGYGYGENRRSTLVVEPLHAYYKTMPTQRDVALLADVSSASVSRYLQDPESVKPSVRQKIQNAIDTLSYQLDYSAQALKTGKYFNIGILAPSVGPFYFEVYHAVQTTLTDAGYSSTFFFTRNVDTFEHSYRDQVPPFLKKRHLDGVIYFPLLTGEDNELMRQLAAWGRPVVVLDRHLTNTEQLPMLPQAYFENYASGREAAELLLAEGHRQFLFVRGAEDSTAAHERFRGFKDGLAVAGCDLGPDRQIEGGYQAGITYKAVKELCASVPPFTGVFASNDSSALGFIRAMEECGRHCPRDYSIIGFDDNIEFTPFISPSLSTFRQPIRDFGRGAAKLLLSLIDNTPPQELELYYRATFIRRESLGPRPGSSGLDMNSNRLDEPQ